MVTIQCNYLIDLPSLDARKLTKLCKKNEETHECPVDWGRIPCLLPGIYCSEVTANDWRKFLIQEMRGIMNAIQSNTSQEREKETVERSKSN